MSTSIGVRGVQLIGAILLTYLLLPDVVGEAGVVVLILLIINQFTMLGVPQYIVTRKKLEPGIAWHGTAILAAVSVLLISLWLVLGELLFRESVAGFLAKLLKTPNLYDYVPGAILAMTLMRFGLVPERLLQHQMRFREISLIRGVAELSYTASSLLLAYFGYGGMSIVLAHVTRHALQLVLMSWRAGLGSWLRGTRLSLTTFKKILDFGLPFSVAGFMTRIGQQGDKPVMSAVFGTGTAGVYQLSYNLADIPAVQVGEQIIDVLTPSLAQSEKEERQRELIRATALSALVVFPLAIGLGLVAPTLVTSFLREQWAGVAPMLTILSALAIFRPIGWTIGTYLSATDRPKVQMKLSILSVVALFGGMTSLGLFAGPLWACASVGFAFALHALVSVWYVSYADGIKMRRFAAGFFLPLGACVPMVAAVLAVRYGLQHVGFWVRGVNLGIEVVVGGAAYVFGALIIARPLSRELISLVKEAIRRRKGRAPDPRPSSEGSSTPGHPQND